MALLENPHRLRLYNHVLVKADKESEDIIDTGNMVLFKDTSFEKERSKRIYGEVVAVPYKLSSARVHQEDNEFPKAKTYFSGDIIASQVAAYENKAGRRLAVKELKAHKARYCSSPYTPQYTLNHDQPILAGIGDTAWFHYLTLSNANYLGQDKEHNRYYKVPYEVIFCFITEDNHIKMANGYVEVTPYWNEEYEEIEVDGKTIRGKMKGNLVVGLLEHPEYRTGVVKRKGFDFGQDTRTTIKEGDVVIYAKGSEFKNTINGDDVYVMQQWQIIAKRNHKTFIPVGDYVQIRVKKKHSGIIISIKDLIEDNGEVIAVGENCSFVYPGNTYLFNTKAEIFNLEDTILLKEGHIMAKL